MTPAWDELREAARRAEHEDEQLAFLRHELARVGAELEVRRRALADEARDVEELTQFSLTGLLMSVLGTKEARLARERREWVEARLAFEHARDELAELGRRAQALEERAPERARTLRELAEARARRAAEIAARGGPDARRLEELAARVEQHEHRRFELGAVRARCAEARAELEHVADELAESWSYGAADLIAVGRLANRSAQAGKGAALDRAHAHFTRAVDALARLRAELGERALRVAPELDLPSGLSQFDWWVDGVLTDWLTQRRLSQSRARALQLLAAVRALEQRLQSEESAAEGELARDRRLLEKRLER